MSEVQGVYYEHYKEYEQGIASDPGKKTIPYMVMYPTNATMQEFMGVLKEDGFICVNPYSFAITHNKALLINLKMKRFFAVEKAAKHGCLGDRHYSPEEFVNEVYQPWKEGKLTEKSPFENNEFSSRIWRAPYLKNAGAVFQMANDIVLEGRIVKDIKAIGMGYDWCAEEMADHIYNQLDIMSDQELDEFEKDPSRFRYRKSAEIDEPLLIKFEDDDVLAILFDCKGMLRMDMNSVPWDIDPGINAKTFHADKLFRDLIGSRLSGLSVVSSTMEGLSPRGSEYGVFLDEVYFVFNCLDQYEKRLQVASIYDDYTLITQMDSYNGVCTMSESEMLDVKEGFSDPEQFLRCLEIPESIQRIREDRKVNAVRKMHSTI